METCHDAQRVMLFLRSEGWGDFWKRDLELLEAKARQNTHQRLDLLTQNRREHPIPRF